MLQAHLPKPQINSGSLEKPIHASTQFSEGGVGLVRHQLFQPLLAFLRQGCVQVKEKWKWLAGSYFGITIHYLVFHSWEWSWKFEFRAAVWILLGGGGIFVLFAHIYDLGDEGGVVMPLKTQFLTWSAFSVLVVGSALILLGIFYNP